MSKKRWKIGYKVVRKVEEKLFSDCVFSMHNRCEYSLNNITKRPSIKIGSRVFVGGPLCVFKKFEDAWFFNECNNPIFECKYKESDDTKIWYLKQKRFAHKCHIIGKVLADEVILTKRVNKREMKNV